MSPLPSRETLFNSPGVSIRDHLILAPWFPDASLLAQVRRDAERRRDRLGGEWLDTGDFTLITGFLGYSALFTHLAFLEEPFPGRISFLGTAGSLNPGLKTTRLLQVVRIMGSGPLKSFSNQGILEMEGREIPGLDGVTGVSVDMVQRETPEWLQEQRKRKADIVEMELFPLRAILNLPVTALVVVTDLVTEAGIRPFRDAKGLKRDFRRGWEMLLALPETG